MDQGPSTQQEVAHDHSPRTWNLTPAKAILVPLTAVLALIALAFFHTQEAILSRAYLGAAAVLLLGTIALYIKASRGERRVLKLQVLLRDTHYVQVCVQAVLYLYWGWHVSFIYALAPLILSQLIFAYGISMLMAWYRRGTYELGFGPFPVTVSINFFLVFKPEWFHWQFLIVALGFAAKEMIRWQKNGRSAHIFNPSSFTLAVFSLVLLLTGSTDMTLGTEIAATLFNPPNIHVVIFLVSLVPQILFGVTTMTMAAVVTTYLFGLAYFAATGTYFFIDAYIPIAVFLGMQLLITDPSTAPRSASGRIAWGMMYGVGTILMYGLLRTLGEPTFYDKLLIVPVMNLMVLMIDRAASAGKLRLIDVSRLSPTLTYKQRRLAAVGIWAVIFGGMYAAGGVGDDNEGQYLPFWEEACEAGSDRACEYVPVMQENFCRRGSGWACNELGIRLSSVAQDRAALAVISQGCELGFSTACENLSRISAGSTPLATSLPTMEDLPIVLRGSKGPIRERDAETLIALACERGWTDVCASGAGE